jgi:hypothetical protein
VSILIIREDCANFPNFVKLICVGYYSRAGERESSEGLDYPVVCLAPNPKARISKKNKQ